MTDEPLVAVLVRYIQQAPLQTQANYFPWWAMLTIWGVVNLVNLLQSAGFLSRMRTGSMATNHRLGYIIIALAIPAALAMIAFLRTGARPLFWLGPLVFLLFVALMIGVDYGFPIEFRNPPRYAILIPYLVLFFGSILLMGLPMFTLNRSPWLVTVITTGFLLAAMILAMRKGGG